MNDPRQITTHEYLTMSHPLPSVWIERKTKGEITFGVNVPNTDADIAKSEAMRIFTEITDFVKGLQEGQVAQ